MRSLLKSCSAATFAYIYKLTDVAFTSGSFCFALLSSFTASANMVLPGDTTIVPEEFLLECLFNLHFNQAGRAGTASNIIQIMKIGLGKLFMTNRTSFYVLKGKFLD